MINKSKLWFLTLTSIIIVCAVYYIVMPNKTLSAVFKPAEKINTEKLDVSITESEAITAMKVSYAEETLTKVQELQNKLLNEASSIDEKNEAYEEIQYLNTNKALEEKLEKMINDNYKVNSFISINSSTVKVVIANADESYNLANNIITSINKELDNMYVTVKFE